MSDEPIINPEIRDLFKQVSTHIRSRIKLIVVLFLIGIVIGIPFAHRVVDWLLGVGLLPDDVNIIVLTPVEFIMLQVRELEHGLEQAWHCSHSLLMEPGKLDLPVRDPNLPELLLFQQP